MGVAYSQSRAFARTRIACADFTAQVEDMLTDAEDIALQAMESFDPFDPAWQEMQDWEDAKYFNEHGEWPNWAFLAWLDKEAEREECARWEAENPTLV